MWRSRPFFFLSLVTILTAYAAAFELQCVDRPTDHPIVVLESCSSSIGELNDILAGCGTSRQLACSNGNVLGAANFFCDPTPSVLDTILGLFTLLGGNFGCAADGTLQYSGNCDDFAGISINRTDIFFDTSIDTCAKVVTAEPSSAPTTTPTSVPTSLPSKLPTLSPTTLIPTEMPTPAPRAPTSVPSGIPTAVPIQSTSSPSGTTTMSPTLSTISPSQSPSMKPSTSPSLAAIGSFECLRVNSDEVFGSTSSVVCEQLSSHLNSILSDCGVQVVCESLGSFSAIASSPASACLSTIPSLDTLLNNVAFGYIKNLTCSPVFGLIVPSGDCSSVVQHLDAAIALHRLGSTQQCNTREVENSIPRQGFTYVEENEIPGGCIYRPPSTGEATRKLQVMNVMECALFCSQFDRNQRCIGFTVSRNGSGAADCTFYTSPGTIVGVSTEESKGCYVSSRPANTACAIIPVTESGSIICPVGSYISMVYFAMLSGAEGFCSTGFTLQSSQLRCDVTSSVGDLCLGRTSCGLSVDTLRSMNNLCQVDRPLPSATILVTQQNASFNALRVEVVCSEHNIDEHTRTTTTTATTTTATNIPSGCEASPSCEDRCFSSSPRVICEPLSEYWNYRGFYHSGLLRDECYCDEVCTAYGDCCLDHKQYCSLAYTTSSESSSTQSQSQSTVSTTDLKIVDEDSSTSTISTSTTSSTADPGTEAEVVVNTCSQHFECGPERFCARSNFVHGAGICALCHMCSSETSYHGVCPQKCDGATSTTTTVVTRTTVTTSTSTAGMCSEGTLSESTGHGAQVCCPAYCGSCTSPSESSPNNCELSAGPGIPLYPDSFRCCMFTQLQGRFMEPPRLCNTTEDVSCIIARDLCARYSCATECNVDEGCGWSSGNNDCRYGASTTQRELEESECYTT